MENIIEAVSRYVVVFLSENLSEHLSFHNIEHTYDVVRAAGEIGMQCSFSQEEMQIVQVAAWFHDCGYVNAYIGHEQESKKIAKAFLESYGCKESFIEAVLCCIESTKYPQNPSSLTEKVVCDADLYHLTKPSYAKYERALRKEFEKYLGLCYTNEEWQKENCNFLTHHQFHTDYGRKILAKFKEVNLQFLNCSEYI
ncbi:hypothetical protein IW15_18345 [Chryseobacterium soli]|uniref:HD/PDEase domain-containing protein n=1 Tax=Chryseobacterium soli TaxID=445961 RepID=A0A086A348_9FLAO|nr:HD domain-containing protein [Chryseobacterium soli]KFF11112.1 hypothetical protein IW15_18345 [Chryseobacterium soli]